MSSKSEREECWDYRDSYFACTDDKGADKCLQERKEFEAHCPASWVKHFEQR